MKKIVISICLITLLLGAYCIWEIWFLNRFEQQAGALLAQAEQTDRPEQFQKICDELQEYFTKRKYIFRSVISQDDMKQISLAFAEMKSYVKENELEEARVSANEMRQHLTHIPGVFSKE